jgi:hypothetical protein
VKGAAREYYRKQLRIWERGKYVDLNEIADIFCSGISEMLSVCECYNEHQRSSKGEDNSLSEKLSFP